MAVQMMSIAEQQDNICVLCPILVGLVCFFGFYSVLSPLLSDQDQSIGCIISLLGSAVIALSLSKSLISLRERVLRRNK